MKQLLPVMLSAIMLQTAPAVISINIQNPSFEESATFQLDTGSGNCANVNVAIPGWQSGPPTIPGGGEGIMRAVTPLPSGCWPWTPPDGKTVAYVGYGGVISQDTGVRPFDLQGDP